MSPQTGSALALGIGAPGTVVSSRWQPARHPWARCHNTLTSGHGEPWRCAAGGAGTPPGGRVGSELLCANQEFCSETAEPSPEIPQASRAADFHVAG